MGTGAAHIILDSDNLNATACMLSQHLIASCSSCCMRKGFSPLWSLIFFTFPESYNKMQS